MPNKKKLEAELISYKKIKFKIGEESTELNIKSIIELQKMLNDFIVYYENWEPYIDYYSKFTKDKISRNINDILNDSGEYMIGENFALFLDTGDEVSDGYVLANNNEAAEIIKEKYTTEYPDNTLQFDPEYSYCYIYTKDKDEAINFIWWSYKNIIKPKLESVKKINKN